MFIVSNKRFYLRRVCLHQSIHTRAFLALTMVATVRVALFLYNATLNRRTSTQITATVPAATATPTGNDTSSSSRHGTPKVLLPQWYNAVAVSTPSACHRRPKAATAAPQGCHQPPQFYANSRLQQAFASMVQRFVYRVCGYKVRRKLLSQLHMLVADFFCVFL